MNRKMRRGPHYDHGCYNPGYDPDDPDVERRQKAATQLINTVCSLLNPLSIHSPEQRAEWLVRDFNLGFWLAWSPVPPTVETLEYAAAVLAEFARLWKERVRKEELETLQTLLRKYQ